MNWDKINSWTVTLYALIHSFRLARTIEFGNLTKLDASIQEAASWLPTVSSYNSVLLSQHFGNRAVRFRRDPNVHFESIISRIICMLIQDLLVIFDSMMDEALAARGETSGNYPRNKIEKLATHLDAKYLWAEHGCLELVAVRNVLTHSDGKWNEDAISIVAPFVSDPPSPGDRLTIGMPMLFRYRKAIYW